MPDGPEAFAKLDTIQDGAIGASQILDFPTIAGMDELCMVSANGSIINGYFHTIHAANFSPALYLPGFSLESSIKAAQSDFWFHHENSS